MTSIGAADRADLTSLADSLRDHVLLTDDEHRQLRQITISLSRHNGVVETAEIIATLTGLHRQIRERERGTKTQPPTDADQHHSPPPETSPIDKLREIAEPSRKRTRDLHRLLRTLLAAVVMTAVGTVTATSLVNDVSHALVIATAGVVAMIAEMTACLATMMQYQNAVAGTEYMEQVTAAYIVIAEDSAANADLGKALVPEPRSRATTVITARDVGPMLGPMTKLGSSIVTGTDGGRTPER